MKNNDIDRFTERVKKLVMTSLRNYVITITFALSLLPFASLMAQNDSALHRSVTVERDFQPVIQAAGKISTKPAVIETTLEPVPIEYSDYTSQITPGTNISPLLSQPTRFDARPPYNGYLRAALGHPNSLFDFGYHLDDGKSSILDVYAHHKAQWGLSTFSNTTLGLDFKHTYSTCDLYFGLNGGNVFYHRYGHFYDYLLADPVSSWTKNNVLYPTPRTFTAADRTSLWNAEVFMGVKANAKQDFQYLFQTGYKLYAQPGDISEHQVRTHLSFDWHREANHVGAKFYVQNNFMQLGSLSATIPDSLYNGRHNIRMEPYYAYEGKRFRMHLGVNLDLNIGCGQNRLSGVENLSFAPSPHVNMEAQIAKQWLTLYADVTGNHGLGNWQSYMEDNPYRLVHPGIVSHHVAAYTPVDGELGFHIRPHHNLLLELHGGYALEFNQTTLIANTDGSTTFGMKGQAPMAMMAGDFAYTYSDYARGKVGGQMNFHFRDVLRINLYGDYYFWKVLAHEKIDYSFASPCAAIDAINAGTNTTVYDRPNWEAGLRVDARFDKHWSMYSDNRFAGSRIALARDGAHTLQPTIDLDLGLQYDMWVGKVKGERFKAKGESQVLRPEPKPNLSLFIQLNNWLHRKNEFYYGYRSTGINFLMGVTFRF